MNTNKRVYIGIGLIVLAVGFLMFTGFKKSTAYYLTIDEALAAPQGQKYLRVSGKLDGSSVRWDANKIELRFKISSRKTGKKLSVVYNGVKPDNFAEAVDVIVEGRMVSANLLKADQLLVKCPSKYEDQQKKKGR